MKSYEVAKFDFAFRVIQDRIDVYREPTIKVEEIGVSKGSKKRKVPVMLARYFNVNRREEGLVIGVKKIDQDTLSALQRIPEEYYKGIQELVLVVYSKPSDKNAKQAESILGRLVRVKRFTFLHGGNYPMFNIMRHVLVPLHIILTEEEKAEVFEMYEIPEDDPLRLPLIKEKDPVARLIGAKRGDLIMIIRASETAGRAPYFRYVVKKEDIQII